MSVPDGSTLGSVRHRAAPPLPICESQLAKLWCRYRDEHQGEAFLLDGFLNRFEIRGETAREVIAWVKAGASHVCGK